MFKGDMRKVLALMFSGAFIGAFPVLFFKGIPQDNKELLTYMLGQLSGIVLTIIAFHFSSTSGGEKKTEQLAELAKGTTKPAVAEEIKVEGENVELRSAQQ